jgi:iron complex outermembrane receptor protein
VTTAYVMGDLDGKVRPELPRQRRHPGVHTDQQSAGNQVRHRTLRRQHPRHLPIQRVSDGVTFTDVLPSANVSFDLENDQFLRFGVAKVLSRANLDDLRASQGFRSAPPPPARSWSAAAVTRS